MRRSFIIAWAFLLAGLCCIQQSSAFWQSRDSNYNNASFQAQYQGPLDVYSTSIFGWYGTRAASLALAGTKAVNACNPANTCADLSTNASGNLVESSIGGSACYVTISSGTYVSGTGALALTTSAGVTSFASGSNFALSALTGTGAFAFLNGEWTATTGTTGTTVNASVTVGMGTVTVTGGFVSVCPVATIYNQSAGGGTNLTQATVSAQPILTHDCTGSIPCLSFSGAKSSILSGTVTSVAQPWSLSGVASRTYGTGYEGVVGGIGNQDVGFNDIVNSTLFNPVGGDPIVISATDNTLHAMNGANASSVSCYFNVDGSTNSISTCGTAAIGTTLQLGKGGANYLYGYIAEAGVWSSGLSTTILGNLCHNQTVYYGIGGATC